MLGFKGVPNYVSDLMIYYCDLVCLFLFRKDGSWSRSRQFPKDIQTVKIYKEPSYGIYGDRVIILGRNMYEDEKGTEGGVSVDNSPQIKQGYLLAESSK